MINFLTRFVFVPTRQNHILDLVLSNQPHLLSDVEVVDNLHNTDHSALQFAIALPSCYKSQCHGLLYNYSRTDFQIFRDTLVIVPYGIQLLIVTLILILYGISGVTCFYLWLTHAYLE